MKNILIVLVLILSIIILSCDKKSTNKYIGTVTGLALSDGQFVTVVKLDDGTEIKAIQFSDSGLVTVTGGQRVEVEPPAKDSKFWRILCKLETADETKSPR